MNRHALGDIPDDHPPRTGRVGHNREVRLSVLTTAAMTCAVVLAAALPAPAVAALPSERVVTDAVEPAKAWDVVSLTLRSAKSQAARAKVVVQHDRRARTGDGMEVWIDTDTDGSPDLYLAGYAYSEYAVYRARGWEGHGRDISDRACAAMRITGKRSVILFAPSCVDESTSYAVSVRSSVQDRPSRTADSVPGLERLTKYVVSYTD